MSHHSPFHSDAQKSASIRDNALILYFETAETPLVARFDLDSLVQANFEVVKKGDLFVLALRDFSGSKQEITAFATKADAHQALYAILQALLSYGEHKKSGGKKRSLFGAFVKWVFIVLLTALAIAFALTWLATPVSHIAQTGERTPVVSEREHPTTAETAQEEVPAASAPTEVPEGEPMDMEQFISPSSPSSSPSSSDAQTGMTPAPDDTQKKQMTNGSVD